MSTESSISSVLRQALIARKSKREKENWGPEIKWAYCVIGDENAKENALNAYKSLSYSRDKYWIVSALMEAWPDDNDVIKLLSHEFSKSPGDVGFLSKWIDSFIIDPKERRDWLLRSLNEIKHHLPNVAVVRLLSEFRDKESIEAALNVLNKDIWYYNKIEIKNYFIEHFPTESESRKWAVESFSEMDGPSIASVAKGYNQDSSINSKLLNYACPAKENVRAEIFKVLNEYSIPDDSVVKLTDNIWVEETGEIRSAGIVARSIIALKNTDFKRKLIIKLVDELKSLGTYYEMRRCSAFTGLLKLNEYSVCIDELTEESTIDLRWIESYHKGDIMAVRVLTEHLDRFNKVLESKALTCKIPWDALIYNGTAREALSNSMARDEIINHLKQMSPINRSTESLYLMAEILPKSTELHNCLINSIFHTGYRLSYDAQRIFAEQYGRDEQELKTLQNYQKIDNIHLASQITFQKFFYALILGWPDNELLQPYLNQGEFPEGFSLLDALALCVLEENTKKILYCIDKLFQITIEKNQALPDIYLKTLYDWVKKPSAEKILKSMMRDKNYSRKITAIGFLSNIGKMTNEDRLYLIKKYNEMINDNTNKCPDGVDLLSGSVISLPQAIFRSLFMGLNKEIL
jgi:hypothetical protein